VNTGYRFTPEAAGDLFDIWSYIASDNVEAANRVEEAIYDSCSFLAQAPLSGQVRVDLTNRKVRFWTVQRFPNYIIVFRPETEPLRSSAFYTANETSSAFSARGKGRRLKSAPRSGFCLPEAEHGTGGIDDDTEPAHIRDWADVLHHLRAEVLSFLSGGLDVGDIHVREPG